ncbi:MAG: hypothetical protein JNK29_10155 [Anaerolineales bacterium]|nr:hypothetical protein [Anaerolineales bacterium]
MRPDLFRTALGLAAAAALAACTAGGTPVSGTIAVDALTAEAGNLSVGGTTTLPDDACLLTQLMINGTLAPDWPTDCVTPAQGAWRQTVALGAKGQPPALLPGEKYELLVWLRDHPEVGSRRPVELGGPTPQP